MHAVPHDHRQALRDWQREKTIVGHLRNPVPRASDRAPDIPENVDELLLKMLAKDHTQRIQTWQAVIDEIKLLRGRSTTKSLANHPKALPEVPADLQPRKTTVDEDIPIPVDEPVAEAVGQASGARRLAPAASAAPIRWSPWLLSSWC